MILRNALSFTVVFFMSDSTDATGRTAKTGLTPTVQVSKNGGAFATVTNAVSEIANGWYKVDLTTTETNTNGPLVVRATGTGADEWRDTHQVSSGIPGNVLQWNNTAVATPDTAGYPVVTVKDGTGAGELDTTSGAVILATAAVDAITADLIANAFDKGDGLFDPATDSPQAIRDRGDAAWAATAAMQSGTAQAGAASTITLAAAASSTNDYYKYAGIVITGGTGAGQERVITGYVGSTRVATVDTAWVTNPDNTSTYEVGPARTASVAVGTTAVTTVQSGLATATALTTAQTDIDDIQTRLPAALVSGRMDSSIGAAAANTLTASALATDAVTEIVTGVLTTAMTESYAADGAAPTLAQALFMAQQMLGDFAIVGTTLTVRQLDGTTAAATFDLDSATAPTSITRGS